MVNLHHRATRLLRTDRASFNWGLPTEVEYRSHPEIRDCAGNRVLSTIESDFRCYFTMETYRVMQDLGPERRRTDQGVAESNIKCRIKSQFGNELN